MASVNKQHLPPSKKKKKATETLQTLNAELPLCIMQMNCVVGVLLISLLSSSPYMLCQLMVTCVNCKLFRIASSSVIIPSSSPSSSSPQSHHHHHHIIVIRERDSSTVRISSTHIALCAPAYHSLCAAAGTMCIVRISHPTVALVPSISGPLK